MTLDVDIQLRRGAFELRVGFSAKPGVTVIFGPSGAGKSTVLESIAGLLPGSTGVIRLAGKDVSNVPSAQRRVGFVFQDLRLFPHLTVLQNLDYAARFGRTVSIEQRSEIIDILRLSPLLDRLPSMLSGGEGQRVALGRALLSDPQVLLLDEPLSALDAVLKNELLTLLETVRDRMALPILYVTHDILEAARLGDQMLVLEAGKVVQHGPLAQVINSTEMTPQRPGALGAAVSEILKDRGGPFGA